MLMKKRLMMLALCSVLMIPTTVSADILDYEGTINAYKQDNKTPQTFDIDDGNGNKVTARVFDTCSIIESLETAEIRLFLCQILHLFLLYGVVFI